MNVNALRQAERKSERRKDDREKKILAARVALAQTEQLSALCQVLRLLERQWQRCEAMLSPLSKTVEQLKGAIEYSRRQLEQAELSLAGSGQLRLGVLQIQALESDAKDAKIRIATLKAELTEAESMLSAAGRAHDQALAQLQALEPELYELIARSGIDPNDVESERERLSEELKRLGAKSYAVFGDFDESRLFNLDQYRAGAIFDARSFYDQFNQDLRDAKRSIELVSPFVTVRRGLPILSELGQAVERGVDVTVFMKPIAELDERQKEGAEEFVNAALEAGVAVFHVRKLHQKVALIDGTICWEGSLNILSQVDTHEFMRRLQGRRIVEDVRQIMDLRKSAVPAPVLVSHSASLAEGKPKLALAKA